MQRIRVQVHQDSKIQCDKEDVGYLTGNFCIDYILRQWFSDTFSKIKYIMKSDFASLFIFCKYDLFLLVFAGEDGWPLDG